MGAVVAGQGWWRVGFAYDLSRGGGRPAVEFQQVVADALVGAEVGGDAAGFGSSAGGGVDQHGFLDAAKGVQDVPDRQVGLGPFGFQAQEVADLRGQDVLVLATSPGKDPSASC